MKINLVNKVQVLVVITLVFSMFSAGCRKADQIAKQLSLELDQELIGYDQVIKSGSDRGERSSRELKFWGERLSLVQYDIHSLVLRFEKKPEEKALNSANLEILQGRLDKVFERNPVLQLSYVPTWLVDDTEKTAKAIRTSLLALRGDYYSLFGTPAKGAESFKIEILVDTAIYDTYPHCVALFDMYSSSLKASNKDNTCEGLGTRYCGHQMDMYCVSSVFARNAGASCAEEIKTDNQVKSEGTSYTRPAAWLYGFKACHSSTPIYKR